MYPSTARLFLFIGMLALPCGTSDARSWRADQTEPSAVVTVTGCVRDETGNPISNVKISCRYRPQQDGEVQQLTTTTNADGTYQLSNVPAIFRDHQYSLPFHAVCDGYAFSQRNVLCATLAARSNDNRVLEDTDFVLRPSTTGVIKVLDENGNPLRNVTLNSFSTKAPQETAVWRGGEFDDFPAYVSDDQGVILLPDLEKDVPCDLHLTHPDYAQTPAWNVGFGDEPVEVVMDRGIEVKFSVICDSDPAAVAQARVTAVVSEEGGAQFMQFAVDPSGVREARLRDKHCSIRLEHPTLVGLPWYLFDPSKPNMQFRLLRKGTATGRVVDTKTGVGMSNVAVCFVQDNKQVSMTVTNEQGAYEAIIAEGVYSVGFTNNSVRTVAIEWDDNQKQTVEVVANESQSVPDLFATPVPPTLGQVVTSSGAPVPLAIIITGFRDPPILCDQQGNFELTPRRFLSDTVEALHPHEPFATAVSVKPTDRKLKLQLRPEGTVLGALTDTRGNLVPNFPVSLRVRCGNTSTTLLQSFTRNDGTFRFVGLNPGFNFQLAVEGERNAAFLQTNGVSGSWFGVDGPGIIRQSLQIDISLTNEVRDLMNKTRRPLERLPSLQDARWIGKVAEETRATTGIPTLLYFPRWAGATDELGIIQELYGNRSIRAIGVLEEGGMDVIDSHQSMSGAIVVDDQSIALFKRYQVTVNDRPIAIMFDAAGMPMWSSGIKYNILSRVRDSVLYPGH